MLVKLEISLKDLACIYAACGVMIELPLDGSSVPIKTVEQNKRDLQRIMQDMIAARDEALKTEVLQ